MKVEYSKHESHLPAQSKELEAGQPFVFGYGGTEIWIKTRPFNGATFAFSASGGYLRIINGEEYVTPVLAKIIVESKLND